MIRFFCDYCGAEISANIAKRHYSSARILSQRHYCTREHAVKYREEHGEYSEISRKGKDARSTAVKQSNREQPRRKRKAAPIMA